MLVKTDGVKRCHVGEEGESVMLVKREEVGC